MSCFLLILTLVSYSIYYTESADWAFLVAGSRGYTNYRHQADVCHAYQVLRQHGFPDTHIIVMMYDDIAQNPRNPYKGTIVNRPNGPDVYKGVRKDYIGSDVNADNFVNILRGNETHMKNIGTGRVIKSGPNDNVFVFYADHGGYGFIFFSGSGQKILFESQLRKVITEMHDNKQYKNLVFYIEACFSGSMFRKIPSNLNVLALTACNHSEWSYATYCDNDRRTCLGDEFSVGWLEDSERKDYWFNETINDQYSNVRKSTRRSHVMKYGDDLIGRMLLSRFQGPDPLVANKFQGPDLSIVSRDDSISDKPSDLVSTWNVPYMMLMKDLERAKTPEEKLCILNDIRKENNTRRIAWTKIKKIAEHFVSDVFMVTKHTNKPVSENKALCYEKVVETFRKIVSPKVFEYALQTLHVFQNLCMKKYGSQRIIDVVKTVCDV